MVKGKSLSWLIAVLIIINVFWGASGVAVKGADSQGYPGYYNAQVRPVNTNDNRSNFIVEE